MSTFAPKRNRNQSLKITPLYYTLSPLLTHFLLFLSIPLDFISISCSVILLLKKKKKTAINHNCIEYIHLISLISFTPRNFFCFFCFCPSLLCLIKSVIFVLSHFYLCFTLPWSTPGRNYPHFNLCFTHNLMARSRNKTWPLDYRPTPRCSLC